MCSCTCCLKHKVSRQLLKNNIDYSVQACDLAIVMRSCRLQKDLQQASSRLEQQQTAAARSVAEECERHVDAERTLQQQVQQLSSELAVSKVRSLARLFVLL